MKVGSFVKIKETGLATSLGYDVNIPHEVINVEGAIKVVTIRPNPEGHDGRWSESYLEEITNNETPINIDLTI